MKRGVRAFILCALLLTARAAGAAYQWEATIEHGEGWNSHIFVETQTLSCSALSNAIASVLSGSRMVPTENLPVTSGAHGYWWGQGVCVGTPIAAMPVEYGTVEVVLSFWGADSVSPGAAIAYVGLVTEYADEAGADEAVVLAMFAAGFVPTLILYFTAWSIGLVIRGARGL